MVKKFIIHIGTEKTGSTSIQAAGRTNRSFLAKHGILYPTVPGEDNHLGMTIAVCSFDRSEILRARLGLFTQRNFDEYRLGFWDRLKSEIQDSDCHTVVISSEHLSSRVADEGSIDQIASFALGLADTVDIVVYLRPQHELAASSYSTRVKMGYTGLLREILPTTDANRFFNYDKMLRFWAKAFGNESIKVRIFDRASLKNGNVVDDFFLKLPGLSDLDGFVVGKEENKSLDGAAAEFLRLLNKDIPPFIGGKVNPARGRITSILSGKNFGPKLSLSAEEAIHLMNVFRKSNAAVAKRYLGQEDGALFQHCSYSPVASSTNVLTSDLAVKIAVTMWTSVAKSPPRPA